MNLPVKKIELVLPREGINNLLDDLQSKGFLEIISKESAKESTPEKSDYDIRLSEIEFVLSFLERFKPKEGFAKNLIYSFVPEKESFKEEELREIFNSKKVKEAVEKCSLLEEKINKMEARKEELLNEISVLRRFENVSAFKQNDLKKVDCFVGSVDIKEKDDLIKSLSKKNSLYLEKGSESPFLFNFALFYPKESEQDVFKILKKHESKEETVFWSDHPKRALEKREKEVREINIELEIQKKEAQKLLLFSPKLEALSDWLRWQIEKEEFLKKSEETKNYVVIEAWTAKDYVPEIKKTLKEKTNNFLIKNLPIKENDNPPVILQNKGVTDSFNIVTGVYGLPKKNEIDPTPYLAPFFIFYFALALSDSGYGILLAAFAFMAKKMFKKAGADKFFNLFIFSGILTAIVGFFVGTVFGSDILENVRIADPMSDPIGALLFVLALGVFQVFVGLIIGMVWLIRSGKTKEAIAGNGSSIVFFVGAVLFLITDEINFMISGAISMPLIAFIYSDAKSIFQKLGKAFGSLYGLIGFVGDILSYSRILALGLATGIIASVINMMALIFKDMIPVPGVDLAVAGAILVIGHVGNLLINALGAFIHSARLQFVEFFSKFMEGGGRHFKPLSRKGRYIEIIN